MSKSLLEKFNKGIHNDIHYTQEELKELEKMGVDDIDEIDRVGFVEVLQKIGKTFLGYFIGKPAKSTEPVLETGVAILSDAEKKLSREIELVDIGKNATEYARRAIVRACLRKRVKHSAQYAANQIGYISGSIETPFEPFLDKIEQPLAGAGTAIGDYAATNTSLAARNLVRGMSESVIGALETVKNIPSSISNYAQETYQSLPDLSSWSSQFWMWVDASSDFFYVACALVILGKFDFLLKNTYLIALIAIVIVYTIHKT